MESDTLWMEKMPSTALYGSSSWGSPWGDSPTWSSPHTCEFTPSPQKSLKRLEYKTTKLKLLDSLLYTKDEKQICFVLKLCKEGQLQKTEGM